MGKKKILFLFSLFLIFGIFEFVPRERSEKEGIKIAAAKDISWELLSKISQETNLHQEILSETLMGDC